MPHYFPGVTLLITHYNRSNSLGRLLKRFRVLDCIFDDIIVSDDGSSSVNLLDLKNMQLEFSFRLIGTHRNRGLGNNLNKGQAAVTTPYTLYVQEDFVPTSIFPAHFRDALDFMNQRAELDIVRFFANTTYPYLKPWGKGFSEMVIKPWYLNYTKIYFYGDPPHLRRMNFVNKFGPYAEGLKGDRTEYRMCISFIQKRGKGLFFDQHKQLFTQQNTAEEPSTMIRNGWTTSNNIIISFIRYGYRQLRYNYDLLFTRY